MLRAPNLIGENPPPIPPWIFRKETFRVSRKKERADFQESKEKYKITGQEMVEALEKRKAPTVVEEDCATKRCKM